MTEQQRREYFNLLLEEHVWGNNLTSEWANNLSVDAMHAFYGGAYLSAILVGQAAMECQLRYESLNIPRPNNWGFGELIDKSSFDDEIKKGLHVIRKYRNKWVHVNDPDNDLDLLEHPEYHLAEMEDIACQAMRLMLILLYRHQTV